MSSETNSPERFNVVGTSGSGKTTFSRALARRCGLPCHEMDQMFWKPGWTESSDAELRAALDAALAGPRWVLDGNYTRTLPEKWRRVQVVIWLDLGFVRTVFRVCKRALHRSIDGREIWPDTGNCESLGKTFFSRDSIVWWAMKTYFPNRAKYRCLMQSPDYPHIRFVRLRSPAEIAAYLGDWGGTHPHGDAG